MKKRLSVLVLSGALVPGVATVVQALPRPGQVGGAAPTDTPSGESLSPTTTLRVMGTIDRYDPSTRTLSLWTPMGIEQFSLASTTRIRHGWQKLDDSALNALAGNRAVVRYLESAGRRTVESVHVLTQPKRTRR